MDIPAMSMAMSNYQVSTEASMKVMKLAMGNMELTGEMITELMASMDTSSTIDIKL